MTQQWLDIFAYILLITYPVIEGIREHKFFIINKGASFHPRYADVDRKWTNVTLFILATGLATLAAGENFSQMARLFIASAFYRWLVLDGILNQRRKLGFWYAGNSGRAFTDRILYPLPIWKRVILKSTPFVAALVLYILKKYFA